MRGIIVQIVNSKISLGEKHKRVYLKKEID